MDRNKQTAGMKSSQTNNASDVGNTQIDRGPLDDRMGYWLRRAQIAVFDDFFHTFADMDIRPAQYSVLTIIERNPGLTQGQVADALGIQKANFVALIKGLESRGLVKRAASRDDKRSYALSLTQTGSALMTKMQERSQAHEERMRAIVGEGAYKALRSSLEKLTNHGIIKNV